MTSHKNFGHPSSPNDASQGGVPCWSFASSKESWYLELNEHCFRLVLFDALGFLSDSFKTILSPYLWTSLNSGSSKRNMDKAGECLKCGWHGLICRVSLIIFWASQNLGLTTSSGSSRLFPITSLRPSKSVEAWANVSSKDLSAIINQV